MQRAPSIDHRTSNELDTLGTPTDLPHPLDTIEEQRDPSMESDTSEHSYTLQVRAKRKSAEEARRSRDSAGSRGSRGSRGSGESPFATADAQATPIPRDSLEEARRRLNADDAAAKKPSPPRMGSINEGQQLDEPNSSLPTPHSRMAAFHDYRQQIGTKGAFSLELPPQDQATLRRGIRVSVDMTPAASLQNDNEPVPRQLVGRLIKTRRRLPIQWVVTFGMVSTVSMCVALTTLSIGIYNFTKLRQNRSQKSIQGLENDLEPIFSNITSAVAAVQLGVDVLLSVAGRRAGPP